MKISAIITAAGLSSRMGEFKQLIKIGNLTMIERIILTFRKSGIDDIAIITGHRAEDLKNALSESSVSFLHNAGYKNNQMLDSVKIGIEHFKDSADKIFLTPVDIPLFSSDTVKLLIDTAKSKKDEPLICPSYKGKNGHPLLMDSSLFSTVLSFTGDGGLRGAFSSAGAKFFSVETQDEGTVTDADYASDLVKLESILKNNS